jgi:2-keto-3-deoxy-L-rhamnonate aldolase RhmA
MEPLLERLERGDRVLGMMVASLDPAITDILGAAGFDFAIFDNEASPVTPEVALGHVRAAEARGLVPLVRVIENSPVLIRQFLDVGCRGIVVPHLDTAAEVEKAVSATQFAPRGIRGMCPCCHAAAYSPPGTATWQRWHDEDAGEILVMPIIESVRAVENVKEIVAIDGVEVVLFGPGDLSQDMGLAHGGGDTKELDDAWRAVSSAAHDEGKYVFAFPYPDPTIDASRRLFDEGADGVVHFMDLLLFHHLARQIAGLRERTAEPAVSA